LGYAEAFNAWRQAPTDEQKNYLMTGDLLAQANEWSANRAITPEDEKYIEASSSAMEQAKQLAHKLLERRLTDQKRGAKRWIAVAIISGIATILAGNFTQLQSEISLLTNWPWSAFGDDTPLANEIAIQLRESKGRAELLLIDKARDLARQRTQQDPWLYGDILAAVGAKQLSFRHNNEHLNYFENSQHSNDKCWNQGYDSIGSCHMDATAWILLSLATNKISVSSPAWESFLDQQQPAGWWPTYAHSGHHDSNASTFATAMGLYTVSRAVELKQLPAPLMGRAKIAVTRASQWLSKTRENGCTWYDYPYRLGERSSNQFHSGISLFALNQAKWPGLKKDIRSQCIDLLRTATTDISKTNGSLLTHQLDNGRRVNENTRYQDLIWSVAGLASLYPGSPPYDKARIRREIRRLLFSTGSSPEQKIKDPARAWQLAEYVYVANFLLDRQ
jgi:hypothetical protein